MVFSPDYSLDFAGWLVYKLGYGFKCRFFLGLVFSLVLLMQPQH